MSVAKPTWERVTEHREDGLHYGTTARLRVPGGWLYRHWEYASDNVETPAIAMVFVPEVKGR